MSELTGVSAFHRVGEPRVQRELAGLADGTGEEAERNPHCHARRDEAHAHRFVDVGDIERVETGGSECPAVEEQVEDREQETEVAKPRDQERLLRRRRRGGLVVPEPDKQVRRQADKLPEHEQLNDIGRYDQSDHRGGEERHIGEVPRVAGITLHVARGVDLYEEAHPGHDDQHDRRKPVHEYAQAQVEFPDHEPLVARPSDLPSAVVHDLDEQHEGERERDCDGAYGYLARDLGEAVEERANERHDQDERR